MRGRALVLLVPLSLACRPGEIEPDQPTLAESAWIDEYAEVKCNLANVECDCTEPLSASLDECLDFTVWAYEMYSEQARAAGLTYDPVCAAQSVEWTKEVGCTSAIDYDYAESCSTCTSPSAIYYGEVAEGEACTNYGVFSDCAKGLACFYGTCVGRCDDVEVPRVGEGETCNSAGNGLQPLCEEGLRCDFGDTDTCVVVPGIGEACPDGECVIGAYCSDADPAMPVCIANPGEGDPCPEGVCG